MLKNSELMKASRDHLPISQSPPIHEQKQGFITTKVTQNKLLKQHKNKLSGKRREMKNNQSLVPCFKKGF